MNREFVPYAESLELKQLGFDEPCFGYYEPNGDFNYIESNILKNFPYLAKNSEWKDLCGAPTYSQVFRWFRDKKSSDACICRYQSRDDGGIYYYYVINHDFGIEETRHLKEGFFSYEQAELACLRKLIEIVKNK